MASPLQVLYNPHKYEANRNIPTTLVHGTTTGLVERALDNKGIYGLGFNPKTMQGYPIYFAFSEHRAYAERMARRIIEGKSEFQAQINEALKPYEVGDIIVLEFNAGSLPPLHYEHDDMRPNSLFTNRQVLLDMLTEPGKKEVEFRMGAKAVDYFEKHPLRKGTKLRIVPASQLERLALFGPSDRQEMKKLMEAYGFA